MHDPTLLDHLLAVLVGVLLPLAGALLGRPPRGEAVRLTTEEKIALYWGNGAVLAVPTALVLGLWLRAGRPLGALGFDAPRPGVLGPALAAAFALLYALDLAVALAPRRRAETRRRWRERTPFLPTTPRELAHSSVLVVSAAVLEEVLFRGFLVAHLRAATGSVALAVLLPAGVFALAHLYQGAAAVLKIALGAALLGAILVATGSLWIPIALHFLTDLVGVLLGPRLLAHTDGIAAGDEE